MKNHSFKSRGEGNGIICRKKPRDGASNAPYLSAPAPLGDRPSSGSTRTSRRSPFISQHPHLWAIALISQHPHLWAIAPNTFWELERATQI
ncbi:hypothetical protein [Leptolyngbya sp. O-77]|uniref:hypothetical protein n=1 Tax=Leptolyngbya sp. O-77 TaxID=1080068 RepID=UPI0012E3B38B|nr:hypothetical protein [Leptolyngbya sp. O-77]